MIASSIEGAIIDQLRHVDFTFVIPVFVTPRLLLEIELDQIQSLKGVLEAIEKH